MGGRVGNGDVVVLITKISHYIPLKEHFMIYSYDYSFLWFS